MTTFQRNAFVISGGPSSGKTTTIEYLRRQHPAWRIMGETASEILGEWHKTGHSRENEAELSAAIIKRQLDKERQIASDQKQVHLLDRGLGDPLAYQLAYDGKAKIPKGTRIRERYILVFILEPLAYVLDGVRMASEEMMRSRIHRSLLETYVSLGHEVVLVPVDSVVARAEMITRHITEKYGLTGPSA